MMSLWLIGVEDTTPAGIADVFWTESKATGAWAEDPTGNKLCKKMHNLFATSNRRSRYFCSSRRLRPCPRKASVWNGNQPH